MISFVLNETRFGDKLVEATEEKKRRQLIAEAENYAADQESDRIRKLYKAYLDGIRSLHLALGGTEKDGVNPAMLEFLSQQKWATAYEKNQSDQRTFVLHGSTGPPALTLPHSRTNRRQKAPLSPTSRKKHPKYCPPGGVHGQTNN